MNVWLAEIWHAWRASLRKPGFLLLASGVLALGVGASVAVFALIDATLLRPLLVPQPTRLAAIGDLRGEHVRFISPLQYRHLASLDGVRSVGMYQVDVVANVTEAGAAEQVPAIHADRGLLPALGLRPMLGRNFSADEDRPGGPPAVLLGYGFWQRHYGSDPGVVGRSLSIESVSHTIVGVLPPTFQAVTGAGDLVLPLALPSDSRQDAANYLGVARLSPGTSIAAVSAQIDARLRTMYRAMGEEKESDDRYGAEDFAAWKHQDVRSTLMLFLASGCFVLLIALVNLTNLMLLRALSRSHDAAVRNALGAPLLRLVLPALGEGLLVGGCGALLGMLLAMAGLASLQAFVPTEWLPDGQLRVGAVAWLLAFGAGLCGASVAALLAVWRSRRKGALEELREGGRSGIGARAGRLGRALVVAQVTLAVALLCAAGLFMHALYDAARLPLGFGGNILTFELAPVKADYPDAAAVNSLAERLVERLSDLPGATGAAVTTNLPSSVGISGQLNINVGLPDGTKPNVQYHGVDPGFFGLFSIPLREGRTFDRDDASGRELVAVVSRNLAERIDGGHALGKQVRVDGGNGRSWVLRIVGVVGDTYQEGPLFPQDRVLYVPLAQMPAPLMTVFRSFEPLRFAVRGHGDPMQWRSAILAAVAEVAPTQPIANLRSMDSIVNETTRDARLSLWLVGLFAALALLLAGAGMYAVMAVAVAARERELGVRTALGASPSRLLGLVLRGGLRQLAIGLALGVAGVLFAAHGLSRVLMELLGRADGLDPVVLLGVCVVLLAAGLLACLLPAMRAARVHPMRALRNDP
ncbi:ADOP family duplicated permease [Frateuria sp. YIM B11624]|uniref:ADOP family duplicated permease n=1 Tax=Frateuria sp. YIM B11624 TaxID=3143185 RepID=UPI003C78EC4E